MSEQASLAVDPYETINEKRADVEKQQHDISHNKPLDPLTVYSLSRDQIQIKPKKRTREEVRGEAKLQNNEDGEEINLYDNIEKRKQPDDYQSCLACKRTVKITAIVIIFLTIIIPFLVKIIFPARSVFESSGNTENFINKIFLDLEKDTWINQTGVVEIIYASYSYDPKKGRLLTEAEYRALPIGFIDLYDQTKGVVVRAQNPENFVFYIELQKIVDAYNVASAQTNRLLSQTGAAGRQLQADATSLKKYISDAINAMSAGLMEVPQSRIIVEEKIFWMGRLVNGNYEISTAAQPAAQITSGQTAAELNKTAWSVVSTVLRPILSEKMDYLNDYGTLIADKLSFNFDRYTQIYKSFEVSQTLSGKSQPNDQEANSTTDGIDDPMVKPLNAQIQITTKYTPILPKRPYNGKDSRTMTQQTYEFAMDCIDYNQTVKLCTPEAWFNSNCPYLISEQSRAKKDNFTSYMVFQVRVMPLSDDQMAQKPRKLIDMESFSSGFENSRPPSEGTPVL